MVCFFARDGPSLESFLTAFETTSLNCNVTVVLLMCIFKKLTRIGEFLRKHFNIEDGKETASLSPYDALLGLPRWHSVK